MVPKPGWLNRQFDQVSKNVDSWPDWMKRAAGFEEEPRSQRPPNARDSEEREQNRVVGEQQTLHLKT